MTSKFSDTLKAKDDIPEKTDVETISGEVQHPPLKDGEIYIAKPEFDNPHRVYLELATAELPEGRKLTCRERKMLKRQMFTKNWRFIVLHKAKPAPKKLTFKQQREAQAKKKAAKRAPAEARPRPDALVVRMLRNRGRRGKHGLYLNKDTVVVPATAAATSP